MKNLGLINSGWLCISIGPKIELGLIKYGLTH